MTRTRFAPSPTGMLHIGVLRTALFAWLVARQDNGQFLLRIEDTDKSREVEAATDQIKEVLRWLKLNWDEGPDVGGEYGPYTQSDRLSIYQKYAQKLVDEGKAYADPTTAEQLTAWRAQAKAEKRPFHFNDHRPDNPPTWEVGLPLRLRIDTPSSPEWHDLVRGPQAGSSENIDDFILIKADGYPTYNFAHIIDDYEMQISHVIRGEEFVSSMPKFLMLYEALDIKPPQFAHVPPILAEQGNKKLSKRDSGANALIYRDRGFLPEAVINFLALMGWNDGTEQEIYTRDQLVTAFSLERVQKAGARYDEDRLQWINGHHIRALKLDELYEHIDQRFWPDTALSHDDKYRQRVLGLVHERLKFFAELKELTWFFFEEPTLDLQEILEQDKQLKKKLDVETAREFIAATIRELNTSDFSESDLEERLRELVSKLDTKTGLLFKLIRISITGSTVAPGLFETIATIGQDKVIARLQRVTHI